ncbi:hypothetical protein PUMCH_002789 [Australozyma saopauloensis]|uniref:XPG N-terminal domain-containing protein n=1 Tax=Australozyma saopauloensis TaxID=291208 RepID=A0AAX4HA83_9ASCO|nr:hypothetical protein PUMCH_002789 [[Candida] saopauloensis]
MPITSLEPYINENRLLSHTTLEALRNSIIGIDVLHYLNRIYLSKKEPLFLGAGNLFEALKECIIHDIELFSTYSILPVFVFQGLRIDNSSRQYNAKTLTQTEQQVESAWSKLDGKNSFSNPRPSSSFYVSFHRSNDDSIYRAVVSDLIKLFLERNINFFLSPYDASFQLSYFQECGLVDIIYGSSDLLLTKASSFIFGIDFLNQEVKIVEKKRLLADMNLTERQLIDLSIIIGCSIQPNTFPHLPQANSVMHQPSATLRAALDLVHQYFAFTGSRQTTLLDYINSLHDSYLVQVYLRAIAACEFMPIMTEEGEIMQYLTEISRLGAKTKSNYLHLDTINEKDGSSQGQTEPEFKIPNDIHAVISQRLPMEVFFFNSVGLLPIQMIEAVTAGKLFIRPPLEGTNCEKYKALISSENAKQILDFQFNVLTQLLNRYYQVKKIEVFYWFHDKPVELNTRLAPTMSQRFTKLGLFKSENCQFTFKNFWANMTAESFVDLATGKAETNASLILTSVYRSLFIAGLVEGRNTLSSFGRIFQKFVLDNPAVLESHLQLMFMLFCMIREEGFESFALPEPSIGGKESEQRSGLNAEEYRSMDLLSRVLMLARLATANLFYYQGPVSRSLLSFRSRLEFLRKSILSSLELSLFDLVVKNDASKSNLSSEAQARKLLVEIPFYDLISSTLLGIISELFFGSALRILKAGVAPGEAFNKAKSQVLQAAFPTDKPLNSSQHRKFEKWNSEAIFAEFCEESQVWSSFVLMSKSINALDNTLIGSKQMAQISKADELFHKFF